MGLLGGVIGQEAGGFAGEKLGGLIGGKRGAGAGANIGKVAGRLAGGAIPFFKDGGPVKKTGLAKVHKGEFVLPKGVPPTKAQKAEVKKLHDAEAKDKGTGKRKAKAKASARAKGQRQMRGALGLDKLFA